MIQIYKPSNTNYTSNGDMTLQPSEAEIQAKLNGTWQADLSHPIDADGRWKYIEDQAVLKMPSFNGEQLFRIVKKNKSDSGIEVTAEPIFLDAAGDCYLKDIRPTNVNGQQALNQMLAPNKKYSGKSDIALKTTAYYQNKNLIQALNGEEDNSFINRWGGEIIYDNFQVIINKRAGGDYGVQILYGKNIEKDGIKEEVDFSDVVTRIYPKAFNGYSLSGNGYVDSPIIGSYPTVKSSTITFEDVKMREDAREEDEANGIIVCDTQAELDTALKKKCQEQYDNGIDKPSVTISINMVALQNTEEYQDYKVLEEVSLGDTVHCKSSNLGIVTDARVTEIKYDPISKKVSSVKIGDVAADYFGRLSDSAVRVDNAIRPDGTVIGQQVEGLINMALAQLKLQSTVAKKVNVRAILLEDTDPNSPLYGAMCWGTQGFQIASERTEDGKDWKWSTFGTAKGFFANLIVAGTMLYDRCRGGTAEIGGINNTSGVLKILDEKGKEIGRWDKDGVKIYSGEINGPEIIAGGTGDTPGVIRILDGKGKEIGRWDKDGVKIYSGEINGPTIIAGGSGNIAGSIEILNENGNQIGSWGKDGLYANSGGELRSKDYVDGQKGFTLDLTNGIIKVAEILIKSLNTDTQSKCAFRFKDGKLELLRQNGDPLTTVWISDYVPEDTPPGGTVSGGWQGKFEIKTLMAGGEVVRLQMDSETGTAKLGGGSAVNLFVGDEAGKSRVCITEDIFGVGENLQVKYGDKKAITGRVEYSDGTYLDLVNGAVVGGNSKAGAF